MKIRVHHFTSQRVLQYSSCYVPASRVLLRHQSASLHQVGRKTIMVSCDTKVLAGRGTADRSPATLLVLLLRLLLLQLFAQLPFCACHAGKPTASVAHNIVPVNSIGDALKPNGNDHRLGARHSRSRRGDSLARHGLRVSNKWKRRREAAFDSQP